MAFSKILAAGMFAVCVIFMKQTDVAVPVWNSPDSLNGYLSADDDNEQAIENLRAFAKLYGYVRYFHPSDEASAIDWERFAIYGAENMIHAESRDDLKKRLSALFQPIAPSVRIYSEGDQPPAPPAMLMPGDVTGLDLVAWQHRGIGMGNRGPYQSIRINRETDIPDSPGFGTILQLVNASPYRGMEIRLEASVKTEVSGSGNQAQLWLRIDRPDSQRGFFDNMSDRPITSSDWQSYSITGTVADDAENIVFGGFLNGNGKAWFDNFTLSVRDREAAEWIPVSFDNPAFDEG